MRHQSQVYALIHDCEKTLVHVGHLAANRVGNSHKQLRPQSGIRGRRSWKDAFSNKAHKAVHDERVDRAVLRLILTISYSAAK
jgi:hypothetical protein